MRQIWWGDCCYSSLVTHGKNSIVASVRTKATVLVVDSTREKGPMEILTSMGLTGAESRQLMKRIEAERKDQALKLFVSAKKSSTRLRRVTIILWMYSLIFWLYVIAMQLRYPESPYWPLAQWLPVRMDYVGEVAFILSFVFGILVINWTSRQAQDMNKLQELT
jgi:hypothetical protein